MANNYYDMTGVLMLDKVTPVIKALFGPYDVDHEATGNQAYIANISESNCCSWECVSESLAELAEELGVSLAEDDGNQAETPGEVLRVMARHFNALENPALIEMINLYDWDDDAELEDLLLIAKAFDDGHGIKGFKTEASWHCSKPRLFEFGGSCNFKGQHIAVIGSSSQMLRLAEMVEDYIAANQIGEASATLENYVESILKGIADPAVRMKIRARLAMQILVPV